MSIKLSHLVIALVLLITTLVSVFVVYPEYKAKQSKKEMMAFFDYGKNSQ